MAISPGPQLKNPSAYYRLLMVIVDLETKEENRQPRQEAALARARHRRGSRRVADRGRR